MVASAWRRGRRRRLVGTSLLPPRGRVPPTPVHVGTPASCVLAADVSVEHLPRAGAERPVSRACDERDPALVQVAVEPRFAPLRADPRFPALLSQLRFPD